MLAGLAKLGFASLAVINKILITKKVKSVSLLSEPSAYKTYLR
jgi:hypothetical protein